MAEYIEREAVVKAFCESCSEYIDNKCTYEGACDTSIIATVPVADVQPIDRWISVKDSLPNEMADKSISSSWSEEIRPSESVLILTTGGSYDVAWYSYTFNDWTSDNETKSYKDWEVSYWQPLPEPPKPTEG